MLAAEPANKGGAPGEGLVAGVANTVLVHRGEDGCAFGGGPAKYSAAAEASKEVLGAIAAAPGSWGESRFGGRG